jgi:hypothetical protein
MRYKEMTSCSSFQCWEMRCTLGLDDHCLFAIHSDIITLGDAEARLGC